MTQMAPVFNTLQYAKKLIKAGVPERQAEIQAFALGEAIEERLVSRKNLQDTEIALKYEIKETENRLERRINEVESKLERRIDEVESRLERRIDEVEHRLEHKINEVESKLSLRISEVKTELIRWVFGLFIAQSAIMLSCLKLMHG